MRRIKRNLDALPRRTDNLRLVELILPISNVLEPFVPLRNTGNNKRHLRQRKVLSDADPWPAVERDVVPGLGLPDFPALWGEDVWVCEGLGGRRVQVFAALHGVGGVDDAVALHDGDGEVAVRSAAIGEGGVCEGEAEVVGDGWVEAEAFVDGVFKVFHVLQVLVGWSSSWAYGVKDFFSELGPDFWVVGHLVVSPGETGSCSVSSCQQDGDDLVPDHYGVSCKACKSVEECKVLVRLSSLLYLLRRKAEGLVNKGENEVINDFDCTVVFSTRYEFL